jgi:hypothetical protein
MSCSTLDEQIKNSLGVQLGLKLGEHQICKLICIGCHSQEPTPLRAHERDSIQMR